MIAFIDDQHQTHGIEPICKVLAITPSTYHDDVAKRADSGKLLARARRDGVLKDEARRAFEANLPVDGTRNVWRQLHADKGYDTDRLRRQIEASGAMPNIPPKSSRTWKDGFKPLLYRDRNAIERVFCRLEDFRRIAIRYDRNAYNFLAAVCIAATVSYWL